MWAAFKNRSEKFSQPGASSGLQAKGLVVDFLENVWYAFIEVEAFLKTTSTASGGWGKIESRFHF
ncbi:MAG: hypothetical protein A2156_13115 [Deltaproteobacteria bacterium RBG_16_48_10]|nr:MAG: hypothetical protein A2156_13115 [Deltaproteobacteria bacterium RBG_16_48_10]